MTLCPCGCEKEVLPPQVMYATRECAKEMNRRRSRERGSAYKRVYQGPPKVLRTCLSCSKEFMSGGPQNRICGHCNELNESSRTPPRMTKGAPSGKAINEDVDSREVIKFDWRRGGAYSHE